MSMATASVTVTEQPEYDSDTGTFRVRRSLRPSGNSTVVSIPPIMLQALDVGERDDVELIADPEAGELIVRRADGDR